jgi:hypothetical protein
MLWIRNVARMEDIQAGTKCVGNTEWQGRICRPGADWRILLKPLREIRCSMELALMGIRWEFFWIHTVHEIF